MWIKSSLAAAALAFVTAAQGHAQAPSSRTTLARAHELIDTQLERAANETDSDLKRRLQIEGYVALLSLPAVVRQYEAADRLRRIDEALSSTRTPDHEVEWDGLQAATALAEQNNDFERLAVIDRQYYNLNGRSGENQYLRRLIAANDPQALSWYLQTLRPGVGEPAGLANRHVTLDWLCRIAPPDLVRATALRLTEPEIDDFVAPVLAELGEAADAERRADRQMGRVKFRPVGAEILGRMVALASRRGDKSETQRLARKLIDTAGAAALFMPFSSVDVGPGPCGGQRLQRGFVLDWLARSVYWIAAYPLNDESRPDSTDRRLADAVAGAVASVAAGPDAVELIDRMIGLLDQSVRDKGIDEANMALLAATPNDPNTFDIAGPSVFPHFLRKALRQMRVMAGAPLDDAAARDLTLEWFMTILGQFPQSGLARRILTLSDDERLALERAKPRLLEKLQFVSLVMEGRAAEASALREAKPAAAQLDGWRVLYPIEAMENTGLRDRARIAFDAYRELFSEKDLAVIRLLLVQGRAEEAKPMMRAFVAGEAGRFGQSEVFLGTMLLREQGDRTDVATLLAARPAASPEEAGQRLIVIADSLAWQGASDEIAAAVARLDSLVPLTGKDADCVRDSLVGLQAVALARRGDLEGGCRLVADRELERRQFCWPGRGYESGKPIFDLRYLVQEWARRGHAVPGSR